jgi:hypothetical protein
VAFATHRTQQEKHKGRVGGDPENVVIMQNKAVDPSEMDKSKVYVQIGAVNPHADSSRVTPHARNFHISTPPALASIDSVPPPASHAHLFSRHFGLSSAVDSFIFETGYTAQGKNVAEGLARQQKKKIMFKTSLCFPYILTRLPVVSTENVRWPGVCVCVCASCALIWPLRAAANHLPSSFCHAPTGHPYSVGERCGAH